MANKNYYIKANFAAEHPDFIREILETVPVCIKVFDKNLKLVFMNAQGLTEHMLTATSDFKSYDYFASIAETDREKIKQLTRDAFEGKIQFTEFEHIPGLSRRRWCFSVASPLYDPSNKVRYSMLSSMDFTEHEQAEIVLRRERRMLKLLFDATPLCIKWFNIKGKLISVNKTGRAEHFLLNKDEDEIKQWDYFSCIDKEYHDIVKRNILAAINNEETEPFLFRHVPGTSSGLWCKGTIVPVRSESGKAELVLFVSQDVTKEKEVENLKAMHIEQLEQLNKTKSDYVLLVAHQLNTPIAAINWNLEMLLGVEGKKLTPEQKRYAKEIYVISRQMSELVKEFLDISRIELGIFEIQPQPIKISKIADSVLEEFASQIAAKNLMVRRDYEKKEPLVEVDLGLTRIVLQNLISNSVKYTPKQGHITVKIRRKDGVIEIRVADTGYGIPHNQQEKVFTKFFRANNIAKIEKAGTGLGLYIVKEIIDKTGGSISFESEENKGTVFYVVFPLTGMKKV